MRREKQYQHLPSVNELAFLIGRKIAEEGTKPAPFFKPALNETKAHFQLALEKAIDEDVAEYIEQKVLNGIMYEGLFM